MSEAVQKIQSPFSLVSKTVPEDEAALARARAFLERYVRLDRSIENKLWLLQRLKAQAGRVTRPPDCAAFGGEDGRSLAVVRYMVLNEEINRDQDHLVNIKGEVFAFFARLNDLDSRFSLLLDDRYLKGMTLAQVALRNGYSERHTKRLLRAALIALGRALGEDRPMQGYVSPLK